MTSKVEDIGVTEEERHLSGRVLTLKADLSNWGIKKVRMEQDLKRVNERLGELQLARRPKAELLDRTKIHRQLVTHLLDIDTEEPVTGMVYGAQQSKWLDENYHMTQLTTTEGKKVWHLLIERSEWMADTPEELEDHLFDFLDDEGLTLADLHSAHMSEFPNWNLDFIMPRGFKDNSWHNDAMPQFTDEKRNLRIWADYSDPKMSEWGEQKDFTRFMLETMDDDLEVHNPNSFAESFATIEELVHYMDYEMSDMGDSEDRLNLMEKGL